MFWKFPKPSSRNPECVIYGSIHLSWLGIGSWWAKYVHWAGLVSVEGAPRDVVADAS